MFQTSQPQSLRQNSTMLDDQQTWIPLEIYNLYRTIVAAILNMLFLLANIPEFSDRITILSSNLPKLLSLTLYGYLAFSLLCHFMAKMRKPDYRSQALIQIFVDILAITLLMQASGGLSNGLATLLVVVICAASVLLPGELSFFCAAIASLSLISNQVIQHATNGFWAANYPQAGTLGVVFFVTAGIINLMSRRLAATAQLAFEHEQELKKLQILNGYVVERIKIGALVVDEHNVVALINKACLRLLGKTSTQVEVGSVNVRSLSPALERQIEMWRRDTSSVLTPFSLIEDGGTKVIIQPFKLGELDNASLLIFMEDLSVHIKETQEVKLAAVGRLTASIAHELRNPLMAISHATQLLSESKKLTEEEKRLITIVEDNTKRTNVVIENILLVSRSKPSAPVMIELLSWVQKFSEDLKLPMLEKVKISIDIPEKIKVFFDPEQLQQVLINLCENGARYSFQNTGEATLELRAGMDDTKDQRYYLDIIDFGRGVAKDLTTSIFEPFFTTEHNGNGLGLFIVKSLCDSNQSQIQYHPDDKGRSCFRITFAKDMPITT